jgi:hypothetical protein
MRTSRRACQCRAHRVQGIQESRHHGVTYGLDDGAIEALGNRLQMLEMLLHEGESIEVSEAIIERR